MRPIKTPLRPRAHRAVGRGPPASGTGRRYRQFQLFSRAGGPYGQGPGSSIIWGCWQAIASGQIAVLWKANGASRGDSIPSADVPVRLGGGFAAGPVCCVPPIPQSQIYHGFADQRTLLGIPNFWNVVSNLPFILVGALGLQYVRRDLSARRVLPRRVPDRLQLVLLPLESERRRPVLGSPADVGRVHGDPCRMSSRSGSTPGWAGCCSGRWSCSASSACWCGCGPTTCGSTRWVQFFPCVVLPLMFWLFAPKYTGTWYWFAAAGWYLLAKLLEHFDAAIYSALARHGRPRAQACRARPRACYAISAARSRTPASRSSLSSRYFSSTKIVDVELVLRRGHRIGLVFLDEGARRLELLLVEVLGDRVVDRVFHLVEGAACRRTAAPCRPGVWPTAMSPLGGSFGASAIGTAAWNWKFVSSNSV